MALGPDSAGGNPLDPSHGNEQTGEFFAIAPAIGQRSSGPLQLAVSIFDLFSHGIINCLHLLPAFKSVSRSMGELYNLGVPRFDRRAGSQKGAQGTVGLGGNDERLRLRWSDDRRSLD